MKKVVVLILVLLIVAIAAILLLETRARQATSLRDVLPRSPITSQDQNTSPNAERISVFATNLDVPWGMVFLPTGEMFVTERKGRVRLIDTSGNLKEQAVATINDVKQTGESGLHGITIHPNFEQNNFVYLYYTYGGNGNQTLNRVVRYRYENSQLTNKTIIVDAIPGAVFHDGGRIKFGPDKFLYITTGDAQEPSLAQNMSSLAGKILRVTDEGKSAPNNPFGSAQGKPISNQNKPIDARIYSYGHRNPQGITWDERGQLYATEHGSSTMDELNLVRSGENYGWPDIRGDQTRSNMRTPLLHSGSSTWAPAGAAYLNGSVFFGGLRGEALFQAIVQGDAVELKTYFKGEFGRIRDVIVGPDNMLYLSTSNRDGRGIPQGSDDRIIQVNPSKL